MESVKNIVRVFREFNCFFLKKNCIQIIPFIHQIEKHISMGRLHQYVWMTTHGEVHLFKN